MKVMVVFGTRPEAIKMCPVVLELQKHKEIETIVCLTGQHKEMLDQVMKSFNIVANYNLQVMSKNQTLAMITSKIISLFEKIVEKENPNIVLVHGDTTTSFAAALTAFYRGIAVGHVEAGLRTYNISSPFPEEFNRQSVDIISNLFFAPTKIAAYNLLKEHKNKDDIFITGNTVIDAMSTTIRDDYYHELFDWIAESKLILVTAHRRENIGEPMREIFRAIKKIVENYDVKVIYPVHMNPIVRNIANEILSGTDRIKLIEPLNVYDFHNFMNKSYFIMTDSGGIQEEAPSLGKPVLVMRDTTERPEGIEAGTLKLVGTKEEGIYKAAKDLIENKELYRSMSQAVNPYGDGHASEKIVDAIIKYFKKKENTDYANSINSIAHI